ncbi:nucleotide-diphospho-sugar transferase [Aspergillus spinulosporus]
MSKETKINALDIVELPPVAQAQAGQRYRRPLFYAAHAARWASNVYFLTRLALLLTSARQSWPMWLLLTIEWISAHGSRQTHLSTIAAGYKAQSPRARLRLRETSAENLPSVDVFIPTCGEPLDVVLDTIHAACTLDYPTSRYRVLVLDDAGSATLKKTIEELRLTSYPNLSYNSRLSSAKGRVFAKSANLNYALFTLQQDPAFQPQPEYCAILDADCIPTPDFLRATLPHLLLNPAAALVTTRQYYYNLPPGDPLAQSRLYFYACDNANLDARNRAMDAGSGAVFRRKAILDVGGYPTFSFSEDWQLSLILRGNGHQVLQVEEPLQWGTVPGSLRGHVAQRDRWNIGHAQQLKLLMPGIRKALRLTGKLGWDIGVNGLRIMSGLFGFFVVQWAAPVLLLAVALGREIVPAGGKEWLGQLQLILAILHIGSVWIYGWLQMASTGFRVTLFPHLENSWLAGQHLYAIVKFYCVTSKPKEGSFVTGSTANSWNQTRTQIPSDNRATVPNPGTATDLSRSSSRNRPSRWEILATGAVPGTLLWLVVTAGAALFSIWRAFSADNTNAPAKRILTGLLYPPLLHPLYLTVKNSWVAVTCLLDPPMSPERREMMEATPSGMRFPRADVRDEVVGRSEGDLESVTVPGIAAIIFGGILLKAIL